MTLGNAASARVRLIGPGRESVRSGWKPVIPTAALGMICYGADRRKNEVATQRAELAEANAFRELKL